MEADFVLVNENATDHATYRYWLEHTSFSKSLKGKVFIPEPKII